MSKVVKTWTDTITTREGKTIETTYTHYWAKKPAFTDPTWRHHDLGSRDGIEYQRILIDTSERTVTEAIRKSGRFYVRVVADHRIKAA